MQSTGLETQQDAVRAYVARVGGALVAEFIEHESGRNATRPQLLAATEAATARGAVLVIAKLDRLARNVHFLSGLMKAGAEFVALDLPGANKVTLTSWRRSRSKRAIGSRSARVRVPRRPARRA